MQLNVGSTISLHVNMAKDTYYLHHETGFSAVELTTTHAFAAELKKPQTITHQQKIHWKSIDGLANKGAVRFYPEGEGCTLKMSIAYEVPDALTGMGPAVSPVLESIIEADLKRFDQYAQDIMAGRV